MSKRNWPSSGWHSNNETPIKGVRVPYKIVMLAILAALIGWPKPSISAEAAQPIIWEIENNNRIFSGASQQSRYFVGLCRYLDCSQQLGKNTNAGFDGCSYVRKKIHNYCDTNLYKQTDGQFYWSGLNREPATHWDPKKYEYGPKDEYIFGAGRTIILSANSSLVNVGPATKCAWKVEPVDSKFISGPCVDFRKPVELSQTDFKATFVVTLQVRQKVNASTISYSRTIKVRDVLVLALGDSLSSGEGNPHWLANFEYSAKPGDGNLSREAGPPTWWDARCDRSLFNFSTQALSVAAVQTTQGNQDEQISFTYLNFACSGAQTNEGLLKTYSGIQTVGQITAAYGPNRPEIYMDANLPQQVAQAERNLCKGSTADQQIIKCRHPDYIIMTTGGNEIQFGALIRQSITGCFIAGILGETCLKNKVEKKIGELSERYSEIFDAFYKSDNS